MRKVLVNVIVEVTVFEKNRKVTPLFPDVFFMFVVFFLHLIRVALHEVVLIVQLMNAHNQTVCEAVSCFLKRTVEVCDEVVQD